MLIGMLGISVVVSLASTLVLVMNGYGLPAAFLYGYVGGGVASMVVLATARVLCDRLSQRTGRRRESLAPRTAHHNPEGPYNQ
ncbi:hypothetical protein PANO111632_08280 [Paracoccus nototheniae]|uniref:Uncharacterized protein n=1 Tax=Paracoccus nototheniae TaxID=2489002 RepID=A0ABW4DU58_9RHOB|nr:hypothetical protein [Paracoccus nototheniae]